MTVTVELYVKSDCPGITGLAGVPVEVTVIADVPDNEVSFK